MSKFTKFYYVKLITYMLTLIQILNIKKLKRKIYYFEILSHKIE